MIDNDTKLALIKYLDVMGMVVFESHRFIYFLENETDSVAKVKFVKGSPDCFLEFQMVDKIIRMFGLTTLDKKEVERLISDWVTEKVMNEFDNTSTPMYFMTIEENKDKLTHVETIITPDSHFMKPTKDATQK